MARKSGSSGEKTKAELRAAATRLYARYGCAAVSVRQLAAEVGVQAGAVYLYFDDKQALLYDLLDTHLTALAEAWEKASRVPLDDPLARLERFICFHLRWHLVRKDAVFISYMELRNLTPENFARIEAKSHAYEDVLDGILRDGVARGTFRLADTRMGVFAILGQLNGVNVWYKEGGRLSLDALCAVQMDMVRGLVGMNSQRELVQAAQ